MCLKISVNKKLSDFSLDVEWTAGKELVALFGYSGSGKTMTLKTISGLANPDSGIVCLDGKPLFDSEAGINVPPQKRKTGYVFQDSALFPHMTVLENITYAIEKNELKNLKSRLAELMNLFHIEGLEKKMPSQISGGQRQRVAFARVLAGRPSILLLDEPFSALDSMIRIEMRGVLKKIQRTFNIPVILVTHDFPEALELADKMIVYSDGKIQQEGTPLKIFHNPSNSKVSELLACWKREKHYVAEMSRCFDFDNDFRIINGAGHAA